jgi:TonB family protein
MRRAGSLIVTLALLASMFMRTSSAQAQDRAERKVVSRVAPVYPELAKGRHIGSAVKVVVVIRANGTVKSTRAVGGNPVFIESATDAIRNWKFETASEETTAVVQLTFEPR